VFGDYYCVVVEVIYCLVWFFVSFDEVDLYDVIGGDGWV